MSNNSRTDVFRASLTTIDFSVSFRTAKNEVINSFERNYLSQLLEAAGGNMSKAARIAQVDRMYLHRLCQKHNLRKQSSQKFTVVSTSINIDNDSMK